MISPNIIYWLLGLLAGFVTGTLFGSVLTRDIYKRVRGYSPSNEPKNPKPPRGEGGVRNA